MGLLNLPNRLIKNIKQSIKRFPLTSLCAFIACIFLIILTERDFVPKDSLIQRLFFIFLMAIPLTASVKLLWERRKKPIKELFIYYIISALFLIVYFFLQLKFINYVSGSKLVGINIIFFLLFLFVPYFLNRENFELYSIEILSKFSLTVAYTIILYFGISAILFTINRLLEVKIYNKLYSYAFFICVFVFAVNYFLSQVPDIDEKFYKEDYPKALNILLNYIVIPLLTAYTIILYIYFFKIILTQNWPKGLVSHLVLWYSFITILVIFLLYPIKEEYKISNYFIKIMPKIILPLVIMMFFSMGIRIKAYGITELRYYVLASGIWVFLIFMYWNISKNVKNTLVPFTFAIFILFSTFGPISSFNVSLYSQSKRLKNILIQNNMLVDGKIKKNANISDKDKRNISDIISYLSRRNYINKIKYLPSEFKEEKMEDIFGFSYTPDYYYDDYIYFNWNVPQNTTFDISNFKYFVNLNSYQKNIKGIDGFSYKFSDDNKTFEILRNNKAVYSIYIEEKIKELFKEYGETIDRKSELPVEKMTIFTAIDEYDKVKVKIILNNVLGRKNTATGELIIESYDIYVMFSF